MRAVRSATSLVRHAGSAASEAILVAAIVGMIALALAPVYGPARFMTGSDDAAAAKGGHHNASTAGSTITLDQDGQALVFGATVTFTSEAVGLSGNEHPMVLVSCFDAANPAVLLYRELSTPDYGFMLGGGWSAWWENRVDATCVGELYSYQTKGGNDVLWLAATKVFPVSAY